jgi:hypothetical protein
MEGRGPGSPTTTCPFDDTGHEALDLGEGQLHQARICREQVGTVRERCGTLTVEFHERCSQPPAYPVADHGRADLAVDGIGHSCMSALRRGVDGPDEAQAHRPTGGTLPPSEAGERRPVPDAVDQAERRARPWRRRARRTARPDRVAIRVRKPCFLARRRLLGWKVLFMICLVLSIPGATRRQGRRSRHHRASTREYVRAQEARNFRSVSLECRRPLQQPEQPRSCTSREAVVACSPLWSNGAGHRSAGEPLELSTGRTDRERSLRCSSTPVDVPVETS